MQAINHKVFTGMEPTMLKAGVIGLGKMGLSHQSIINAHPGIELRAVCDTSGYMLDVLSKYTGIQTYTSSKKMLSDEDLDCVFVAVPSRYHAEVVEAALGRGLNVFCEKPFALDPYEGYRLADLAEEKRVVNQVGYHFRFVAAFNEAKRVLDANLLGKLHHLRAEAFGPVVLRTKGTTWRSRKDEGGGCLYDYACHAIDLVNYLVGQPASVSGTVLNSVFSSDVDDEIYSNLQFDEGFSGQLATNWSDESFRKMSVKITIWGENGRLTVDRQALHVYLRSLRQPFDAYREGWNERYTTELTPPVWFYVRGEEYSAQIDHFVKCVNTGQRPMSTFRTASDTSLIVSKMREDAAKPRTIIKERRLPTPEYPKVMGSRSFMRAMFSRT
jgi:scyllo-inositol 2-dehydrogenase (NADP+)